MFDLDPITDILLCLALGCGALVVGIFGLLVKRRRIRNVGWVVPLIPSILLAFPAMGLATGEARSALLPLVLLSSFFGALAVARTPVVGAFSLQGMGLLRHTWVSSACLAGLGLGTIGWQVHSLDRDSALEMESDEINLPGAVPQGLEPIPGWVARTDKGRAVPMMRMLGAPTLDAEEQAAYIHSRGLDVRVIQTAPGDTSYNCHGWVFAGGKAWIASASVDEILEDNGYHTVSRPGVGDLVVFRDADGKVSHSALVRAATEDGGILVESKWGFTGRYVHSLEHHAYRADQATFYHTTRGGHGLHESKYDRVRVAGH